MASAGQSSTSRSGQPMNMPPSTDCEYSRASGTISAPGSRASQTATARPVSYSRSPASTPSAVAAISVGTPITSASPSMAGRIALS